MYISQPSSDTMTHIPTPMPRLSPSSTTSSVNSSTLPSPEDGKISLGPDVKFPHSDNIDTVTESPPSFPYNYPLSPRDRITEPSAQRIASPKVRTVGPSTPSRSCYRPYTPIRASPLEIRAASRTLGLSSPSAMTIEEVQRSKDFFIRALAGTPHGVLKCALDFKLADRESIVHRVSLNLAELRTTEHRRRLLMSIQRHRERDLAVAEEQIRLLETLLDMSHCTSADVSADEWVQRNARDDELIELTAVNEEVAHFQEAVRFQNGRGRAPPGDSECSDSGESDGDGSKGIDSEHDNGNDALSDVPSTEPPSDDHYY